MAISYRRLLCGYAATLVHSLGGSLESGLCSSIQEATRLVLGIPLEEAICPL
ncbi:MAG: hypothetical protein VKI81_05175 [Synechococcaceae cyanobacterium]|nr:hypothetical protein [Synechococcaceae cyanobacterium]